MRKIDIIIFLLFAVMASWQDIRHRGVTVWMMAAFSFTALAAGMAGGRMPGCLCGSLIGFALLLLSHLTRGAIGSGDAWFFMVSGLLLPLSQVFVMFCAAVFLSGIFSLILFVAYRMKSGRGAGADTFPFIPFAAAAGIFTLIAALP